MNPPPKIGILALQGNFNQHAEVLIELDLQPVFIKTAYDLTSDIAGLILPGGESTTMTKLLKADRDLWNSILKFGRSGKPILGTCAGLILMAKRLEHVDKFVEQMGFLDITVQRNAYGPQVYSQFNPIETSDGQNFLVSFIRAPAIVECGDAIEVLAKFQNRPCAIRQGNFMALSFHPELSKVAYFHELAFKNILKK